MPWGTFVLGNGSKVPEIAFGSAQRRSEGSKPKSTDDLAEAIKAGFRHFDTAQQYGNEESVGQAIKQSGIPRDQFWITTKWSEGSISVRDSCMASLDKLGVEYIDLYMIHHEWTCNDDPVGAWRQMEEMVTEGHVKNIGLSAFGLDMTREVSQSFRIKPAMNMIMFHPNVYKETMPLVSYLERTGISLGAYSSCKPLWEPTRTDAMDVVEKIARDRGVTPDQILLAWARAKRAVIFTSSTSRERMDGYMMAGDVELSEGEVRRIEGSAGCGVYRGE